MTGIFTTLFKPLLTKGVTIAWENRQHLITFFKTKTSFKNKDIRFSISYLFKIQIPNSNKYLLVLNRRIDNQLQPVGGAYKRYGDDSLFNKWGYKPDNKNNGLSVDNKSTSDLRFMIKGRYVLDVIKWFESMQERETDPKRELKEELLNTGILKKEIFEEITHKHIRRFSKNLVWSDFFKCYEVLVYDVFELKPNEVQSQALIELSKQQTDLKKGFAIVECDDIEQLRFMQEDKQIARIGQHTKLIINKTF